MIIDKEFTNAILSYAFDDEIKHYIEKGFPLFLNLVNDYLEDYEPIEAFSKLKAIYPSYVATFIDMVNTYY